MSIDMHEVILEQFLKCCIISNRHCLNQEVVIVRLKEEATTFSHTFTSFENSLDVFFDLWPETFLEIFNVEVVQTS